MAWSSSLCASDKLRFLGKHNDTQHPVQMINPGLVATYPATCSHFWSKNYVFKVPQGDPSIFFTFTIIYQLLLVKSQIKTWSNIYLYSTRILEFPIDLFRSWRKSSAIPLCCLGSGLVAPAGGCWNFGRWRLGRRAAVMKKRGGVYNGYIGFIYIYSNI